jgi:hypothetical protein
MAKDGLKRGTPKRAMRPLIFMTALAAVLVSGCGPSSPPMMPNWAAKEQPYTPAEGSSNAYDAYALIARNVEEKVPEPLLNRVYFDPTREQDLLDLVDRHVSLLVSATHKKCEFRYVPAPMFTAPPYQRGWRVLGRALRWKIERACVTGAYDAAIEYAVAATKFGFDLTGGAATDASLGFEIADECRQAIAPFIPKFGAGQLEVLADGLKAAMRGKPSLKQTIENEHLRMLEGVQYVQDAYAKERFDDLMANMQENVRDGVAYLKEIKLQDAKKRPAYFEGFAREADEQERWLLSIAELPALARKSEPKARLAEERPWKSFAKQFFTAAEPLFEIQDNTLARTRLAILTCELLRQVKTTQSTPPDLSKFDKDLTLDPYTGRTFAYRSTGPIFEVYSLGEDGIDNAGDTDENFAAPDLTLERR